MSNELAKQISYILYSSPEEDVKVMALVKDETIWLTQKAMAELIGISASRLNEILSGKREPTLQVARAICINLSIDAAIVLGVC